MTGARLEVSRRTRILTILGVAAIHLAAIAALVAAFGINVVVESVRSIAAFDVPVPPPPPPPATPSDTPEEQGEAAPPAPRATPKPPQPTPPVVIKPKPQPTAASTGSVERSGAKDAGSGSGSAGQGSGTGAGGSGSGSGGGMARRAEKIGGELRTKDFPKSGAGERDGKFIVVRYTVGTDGRVANCRVVQTSGSAEADGITCRLIEKRFRYRPALDTSGNPVPDQTGWKQWWWRPE